MIKESVIWDIKKSTEIELKRASDRNNERDKSILTERLNLLDLILEVK